MRGLSLLVTGLVAGLVASATAQAAPAPMAQALAARDWRRAGVIARGIADPLAGTLVTWLRLRQGDGDGNDDGDGAAVAAFIARHPDWPGQAVLRRRLDQSLAELARGAIVPPLPGLPYAALARRVAATDALRLAWVTGIRTPSAEAAFLAQWGWALDEATQLSRFERLVFEDGAAALRQAGRLGPGAAPMGLAWAALRRGAPDAAVRLAGLDAEARGRQALVLEVAAWERRSGALDAALASWRAIDRAIEAGHAEAFWSERDRLARALLAAGRNEEALALVAASAGSRAAAAELGGWILLRRLDRPVQAGQWFDRLVSLSHGAVGIAEARYWRGRAAAAAGDAAGASSAYGAAAEWPTTFGGQAAARALGQSEAVLRARIAAMREPEASPATTLALVSSEYGRAAEWLVAWGDAADARGFLQRLGAVAGDGQAATAGLALRLGLADVAVTIARQAQRRGDVLIDGGWPRPYAVPAGSRDPALLLAVARQESGFDPRAASPAGALGLMQLMRPTAAALARQAGVALPAGALTGDPALNLALGGRYLNQLLQRFGQPALAAAAYNAGPHRVTGWLAGGRAIGAPADEAALIDWIMTIPVEETRTYVQRVLENRMVYQARLPISLP